MFASPMSGVLHIYFRNSISPYAREYTVNVNPRNSSPDYAKELRNDEVLLDYLAT